ncbi:MAG: sulfotransferase [Bacteroidales bacterium]
MGTPTNFRVNTLLVGAARAGTTSLCHQLAQHPQVCFSMQKEPPYFSIDEHYRKGPEFLHDFFPHYKGEPVVATADTYLFIHHKAIARIANYNPKMRILIMLREPVARAYASFQYAKNNGYEPASRDFITSMKLEQQELDKSNIQAYNNRAHLLTSMYHKHMEQWLSYFPHGCVKIFTLEAMKKEPQAFFNELYDYLGISYQTIEVAPQKNAAQATRSGHLQQLLLNREHPVRRSLKRLLPEHVKKRIWQSGTIDKLKKLNAKPTNYPPITDEEREVAEIFLAKDRVKFQREFGQLFPTDG